MWIKHTTEIDDEGQYWCQECYRLVGDAALSEKGHELQEGDLRVVHSGLGRNIQKWAKRHVG